MRAVTFGWRPVFFGGVGRARFTAFSVRVYSLLYAVGRRVGGRCRWGFAVYGGRLDGFRVQSG